MSKFNFKKAVLAAGIVMALSPNVLLADATADVNTATPATTEETPAAGASTEHVAPEHVAPKTKKAKKKKHLKKKAKEAKENTSTNSNTVLHDTPDPVDLNSD